jgi:hypothetical protein
VPATKKRTRWRRSCAVRVGLAVEASAEAVNAVAYATRNHPEWFWRGAQHAKKPRQRAE